MARAFPILLYAVAVTTCVVALHVPLPAAIFSGGHRYHRQAASPSCSESLWPSSADGGVDHASEYDDDDYDEEEEERSRVFDSVIKVHCTHSEPDYLMPWQRTHQYTSTSSGFVLDVPHARDGRPRIVTNAHAVEYGSSVRVQRRGDDRKYPAVVEAVGHECDLAVLRVDDPDPSSSDGAGAGATDDFWSRGSPPEPLVLGTLPSLQDEVEVLGYPTGGDSMSVTSGVVSRIEVQEYAHAGECLLAMQIDAAINEGNSGGPVIDEDLEVVGVAFQALDGAENVGYVVPVTVLRRFLEDLGRNDGRYTGFCSLGVRLSTLENPAFRSSLGMTAGQSGVMVRDVLPTAPAHGLVRPKDVIVAVDWISVANDGKVPFRRGERVSLAGYVQTKFVGDTLWLALLRNGVETSLDVPVGITRRLVPTHWNNRPPPYLVVAGLVFTALSVPFLDAVHAWDDFISDEVTYLLGKIKDPLKEETDQVVVLAQVLAHQSNLGYDEFEDLHLLRYNGQEVKSLRHLEQLIYANEGASPNGEEKFMRFEFAPGGRTAVLERSALESATRDVCKEHSIQKSSVMHGELSRERQEHGANARSNELKGGGR